MGKMIFSNLNSRLQGIFQSEENFEGFKNLAFDLATGAELYNEEGEKISAAAANVTIRKFVHDVLGINEKSTKRDRKRAMANYGKQLFQIIEEVIDFKVETGFKESEFFNSYVESRNIARGDSAEFWSDEDVILSVTKIAGDHHDFNQSRVRVARVA